MHALTFLSLRIAAKKSVEKSEKLKLFLVISIRAAAKEEIIHYDKSVISALERNANFHGNFMCAFTLHRLLSNCFCLLCCEITRLRVPLSCHTFIPALQPSEQRNIMQEAFYDSLKSILVIWSVASSLSSHVPFDTSS